MNFDINTLDTEDTADMVVIANGVVTDWIWTFAGPSHEATINQANRIARDDIKLEKEQQQARVNMRKWKAQDEDPDFRRAKNIQLIVDRLLDWSDVDLNGKPFPFSPENAKLLLGDRKKTGLLIQALEFLGDERAFIKHSA